MPTFVLDFRFLVVIVVLSFVYAAYEIYSMRRRAVVGQRVKRRSIIGIAITLIILGLVVAFLIPWQKQEASENVDALRQQMEEQEERVRQLEQGGTTDDY